MVHGSYRDANGIQEQTSPFNPNHCSYLVCRDGGIDDMVNVSIWTVGSIRLLPDYRIDYGSFDNDDTSYASCVNCR